MTDINKDLAIAQIVSLMSSYSFDTNQRNPEELVQEWRKTYDVNWIHLATIEALYLGRYKAISIEQILHSWLRMGKSNPHFGGDFERVISRNLPRHLNTFESAEESTKKDIAESSQTSYSSHASDSTEKKEIKDRPQSQLQEESSDFKDPNLPLISTKVTPVPPPRGVSSPKKPSPQKDNVNKSDRYNSQGITTFQPLPDASAFFQKLKNLANNQKKEES